MHCMVNPASCTALGLEVADVVATTATGTASPGSNIAQGGRKTANTMAQQMDEAATAIPTKAKPVYVSNATKGAEPVNLGTKLGSDDATIKAAKWLKPESGYYDVVVHGAPDTVAVRIGNEWQLINHRSLSTYIGKQADYGGGAIRLASCKTGVCDVGFAQNLANKMGVPVTAPTDTLFVFPNGKTVIGPNQFTNSGRWRTFYPTKPN